MIPRKVKIFLAASLVAILCAANSFGAQQLSWTSKKFKEEKSGLDAARAKFKWRKWEGNPLPEYEKLTYSVSWQFVKVGEATMEIRGFDDIDGRKAYHIYSSAQTKPFFDEVFKVRDTNEAWMDAESKCSLQFVQSIDEGGWTKNESLYFNQIDNRYIRSDNGSWTMGDTPPYVQDVMTALYYVRTMDLKVGEQYTLNAHSGDLSWPLVVNVLREESIDTPAGTFDCVVVEPHVMENAGIFKATGQMQVWMTNDEKKIPVFVKVKTPLGSTSAILEEIK